MAINLTTKFSDKVDERFKLMSLTDAHAGHNYEFTGAVGIKVYSVDSVPVVDYTRSGNTRFGTAVELGDTVQEMIMTQDKAFTFTVDAGNAAEQMNIKHVSRRLRTNWDEVATPMIDKYRMKKWAGGAGLGAVNSTALTESTLMKAIFEAGASMSNMLVPMNNRTLFIKQSLYVSAKLSNQIMGIEKLGEKALAKGVVGELDGMKVVPVPDSYFPAGVEFMVKYKNATVDPMKLKTMRVHKNPPGIDGDLGECRFLHDAFVLANKANGIYVYAKSGVQAAPTISISSHTATITASGSDAIYYTTDGSNPKTSNTAKQYSSGVSSLTAGTVVRAYAKKSGVLDSAIAQAVDEG